MHEERSCHHDPLGDTPTTTETYKFFTGDDSLTSSTTFNRRKDASLTVTRDERHIQSTTVPVFKIRDPHLEHTHVEFQFSNDPPDDQARVNMNIEPHLAHRGTTTKFHPASSASTIVGSGDDFGSFSTTTAGWGDLF